MFYHTNQLLHMEHSLILTTVRRQPIQRGSEHKMVGIGTGGLDEDVNEWRYKD